MNTFIKNNYLNIVIAFCAIILFTVVLSFDRKVAIDGDGRDYYSYLVSIFIDHNFTHQVGNDWYLINTPTGTINVHTIGVSILLAPFFFISFLYSKLFGFELNGFSLPFQMGVYFAGIFYCTIGLIFIKKLLLQLNIKQNYIAILIVLVCFGTHLFNYTVNEPSMPHVFSFALTSAFFYFIINLFQKREPKYFYLSSLVLALIILVRPVNLLVLTFVPFFFHNWYDLLATLKVITRSKHFYFSVLVLVLVCSIQSIAWYSQNGKLLQDSYIGNGFYFTNPQLVKMLFGFNNGLFIYVPLSFLLLMGILPIFWNNIYKGLVFIFSLGFILYIFASYWAYNYFDGFGIRTLVDFLPIFIIAGAFLFQKSVPKINFVISGFALVLMIINLIYVYQYRSGIIKANGMNYDKFKYVFLKTNKAYSDSIGGANDLPFYCTTKPKPVFESNKTTFNQKLINDSVYNFNEIEYGTEYNYKVEKKSNSFFVVAEFDRKESFKNSSFNALLSFSGADPEKTKIFQAFRLNDTPSENCCEWKKCKYSIAVTGKFDENDAFKLFIWNRNKTSFFIKNFKVKIYDYSYTI